MPEAARVVSLGLVSRDESDYVHQAIGGFAKRPW